MITAHFEAGVMPFFGVFKISKETLHNRGNQGPENPQNIEVYRLSQICIHGLLDHLLIITF
jgi:hypothetical protein